MSNSKKKRSRGRPSKYPPEFRRDAVAMVLDEDRSIAEVARATGVNPGTLGNWVGQERIEPPRDPWRLRSLSRDGSEGVVDDGLDEAADAHPAGAGGGDDTGVVGGGELGGHGVAGVARWWLVAGSGSGSGRDDGQVVELFDDERGDQCRAGDAAGGGFAVDGLDAVGVQVRGDRPAAGPWPSNRHVGLTGAHGRVVLSVK